MSTLSLTDAKQYLRITGSSDDALLQVFIDAAETALATRVGLLVPQVPKTVRVLASDTATLVLPDLPLVSVASVVAVEGAAVDVAQLSIDLAAGLVSYVDTSNFNDGLYDVTYTPGSAAPIPADLLMADRSMVRHLWQTERGESRKPGAFDQVDTAQLHGAAYLYTFRINELINPHLGPGFA